MRRSNLGGFYLRILHRTEQGEEIKFTRLVLIIAFVVGLNGGIGAQAAMAPIKSQVLYMSPKAFAKIQVMNQWNSQKEFKCLEQMWERESHWNPLAHNSIPVYQIKNGKRIALHAFGIAQMLGEKSKNPATQIQRGIKYIRYRYQTACNALVFHNQRGWY